MDGPTVRGRRLGRAVRRRPMPHRTSMSFGRISALLGIASAVAFVGIVIAYGIMPSAEDASGAEQPARSVSSARPRTLPATPGPTAKMLGGPPSPVIPDPAIMLPAALAPEPPPTSAPAAAATDTRAPLGTDADSTDPPSRTRAAARTESSQASPVTPTIVSGEQTRADPAPAPAPAEGAPTPLEASVDPLPAAAPTVQEASPPSSPTSAPDMNRRPTPLPTLTSIPPSPPYQVAPRGASPAGPPAAPQVVPTPSQRGSIQGGSPVGPSAASRNSASPPVAPAAPAPPGGQVQNRQALPPGPASGPNAGPGSPAFAPPPPPGYNASSPDDRRGPQGRGYGSSSATGQGERQHR
jgi:hypothetical protein